MAELTKENWDKAYNHLQEIRKDYTEIGASGVFALTLTLNPLLIRYAKGERTEELYREMMEVE
jgi:hypothetical protein